MKRNKKVTPVKAVNAKTTAAEASSESNIYLAIKTALQEGGKVTPEKLESLSPLFGSGGHARTQLASDMSWHDEWPKQVADQLEKMGHALENRDVFKFEVISATGCTNLNAPRVNSAQVRDEVLKDIRQQKLDGIIATSPIIVRDLATGESMLFTRARGFAVLDAGNSTTVEMIASKLRAATAMGSVHGLPIWRSKAIASLSLPAVIAWMNEVSAMPYILDRRPGKSATLRAATEGYTALEAVRILGHLCAHRVFETVTGIGPIGKLVVSRTQTKLISWHKGRREVGTVLSSDFDPWSFTVGIERQIDPDCLPMRFDRAMTTMGISRPSKPRKATAKQSRAALRERISGQGPRAKPKRAAAKEPDA